MPSSVSCTTASRMKWTVYVARIENTRNVHVLIRQIKGKRSLGISTRGSENNIKMDLKQDVDFSFPKKQEIFWPDKVSKFFRRILSRVFDNLQSENEIYKHKTVTKAKKAYLIRRANWKITLKWILNEVFTSISIKKDYIFWSAEKVFDVFRRLLSHVSD
jgi:hypothetical protein